VALGSCAVVLEAAGSNKDSLYAAHDGYTTLRKLLVFMFYREHVPALYLTA
jgi:hypothetical protein